MALELGRADVGSTTAPCNKKGGGAPGNRRRTRACCRAARPCGTLGGTILSRDSPGPLLFGGSNRFERYVAFDMPEAYHSIMRHGRVWAVVAASGIRSFEWLPGPVCSPACPSHEPACRWIRIRGLSPRFTVTVASPKKPEGGIHRLLGACAECSPTATHPACCGECL